LLARAYFDNQ
jgi:hypothetical protein